MMNKYIHAEANVLEALRSFEPVLHTFLSLFQVVPIHLYFFLEETFALAEAQAFLMFCVLRIHFRNL